MPTIERNGRVIHYTQEGQGRGIVLVPGLGSGAKLFGTLPRRFHKLGFTCAAVDPVGLAPSGPLPDGNYSFDEAAHDVLECLGETIWRAQRDGTPPDGEAYLECVKRK
jgi:pimeloyl-ACP methyl ester carboxylesterase